MIEHRRGQIEGMERIRRQSTPSHRIVNGKRERARITACIEHALVWFEQRRMEEERAQACG